MVGSTLPQNSSIQIKQEPASPPLSSTQQKEGGQKTPAWPFADEDDDDNTISMIRNQFGYIPNRFCDVNDDDLSDMEASFDDIMMEKQRRIAAKEDEEELKKILEEERRERMRKEMKQQARRSPYSAQQRERGQKRPAQPFADEDDDAKAIRMIRNLFGYNPNIYRGVNDDDLGDTEEEKRRIAAKEDEEELKKIEEEERRERMRNEAKKRKLIRH